MKIPISGTYHTAIPQYAHILTGDYAIEELVWKYTTWFYDQLDLILVPIRQHRARIDRQGNRPRKDLPVPQGS